jgi:hypothetical protein
MGMEMRLDGRTERLACVVPEHSMLEQGGCVLATRVRVRAGGGQT